MQNSRELPRKLHMYKYIKFCENNITNKVYNLGEEEDFEQKIKNKN